MGILADFPQVLSFLLSYTKSYTNTLYTIKKSPLKYNSDLVLLNKYPLENKENTKTIDTVIINWKVLNRNKLDAILVVVKQANNES